VFLSGAEEHHHRKKMVQSGGRGQSSGVVSHRMPTMDQKLSAGGEFPSSHDTYRLHPCYATEVSTPIHNQALAIGAYAHDMTVA
jgi:hypothetical protein